MRVAVISDTHMNQPSGWFISFYERVLADADAVLHCGDIVGFEVWSFLMQHPRFHAARGNCDFDPRLFDELEDRVCLTLDGFTVGLCHGWGSRSGVPMRVAEAFGPEYDLVCFGHTHARYFSDEHGVLLLNPGSAGEHGSVAVVTLMHGQRPSCEFLDIPR